MDADVIVIGAGLAGLTAARELGRRGYRVLIVEARDRVGGRLWSTCPRGWPRPAELGAEFIHGGDDALRAILARGKIRTRRVPASMWWFEAGELRPVPDFWKRIARVMAKIPARNLGWSFQEFLKRKGRLLSLEDRRMAESYAGSFNAAPIAALSAWAQREDHGGADTTDSKIAGRYDAVPERLRSELPPKQVVLRLNTVANAMRWRRGAVTVITHSRKPDSTSSKTVKREESHHARAAIITLPLGVLKAGRVAFLPPLGRKQTLIDRLGWGQVIRITLRFRSTIWNLLPEPLRARDGRAFGFINAPGQPFPVWWALSPSAPLFTGWAGGEIATPLIPLSEGARVREAVRSLAHIFQAAQAAVRSRLLDWKLHDWSHDPFALGAYSYPVAGCEKGPTELAKPVADTLFLAGEATAHALGTVHGAIDSGRRAAKLVSAAVVRTIRVQPREDRRGSCG